MHDGNYVGSLAHLIDGHGCFPLPFPRLLLRTSTSTFHLQPPSSRTPLQQLPSQNPLSNQSFPSIISLRRTWGWVQRWFPIWRIVDVLFVVVTSIQHPHTSACHCKPWAAILFSRVGCDAFVGIGGLWTIFWEILRGFGIFGIFLRRWGVFLVSETCGFIYSVRCLGGLEVENFFWGKYQQTLGLWVVMRMGIWGDGILAL